MKIHRKILSMKIIQSNPYLKSSVETGRERIERRIGRKKSQEIRTVATVDQLRHGIKSVLETEHSLGCRIVLTQLLIYVGRGDVQEGSKNKNWKYELMTEPEFSYKKIEQTLTQTSQHVMKDKIQCLFFPDLMKTPLSL